MIPLEGQRFYLQGYHKVVGVQVYQNKIGSRAKLCVLSIVVKAYDDEP